MSKKSEEKVGVTDSNKNKEDSDLKNIYLKGPVLQLCEFENTGTFPTWFYNILNLITASDSKNKQFDCFAALIYILLYESGFTLKTDTIDNVSYNFDVNIMNKLEKYNFVDTQKPSQYDHFYRYTYNSKLFKLPEHIKITLDFGFKICLINISTHCASTLLHCDTLVYKVDKFVHTLDTFRNMKKLSITFKEALLKQKHSILSENQLKSSSLLDLPFELILNILKYLSRKDKIKLSLTCRHLSASI